MTTARDEPVDAVVDFGIDVIGTADQNHDAAPLAAGLRDHLLAFSAHVRHVGIICGIGRVARMANLFGRNVGEMFLQNGCELFGERPAVVNAHIIVDKIDFAHRGHIRGDDLGIIGNHRAVVVVVAQLLVQVIAHAGVEDGVHALFH